MISNLEKETGALFGGLWTSLTDVQYRDSVELFTKLGVEPWGRIGTGVIELIASILLLVPGTVVIGAFLGVGLMAGAILSHIAVIGIESQGDGGQLFTLAIIVLVCCTILLLMYKNQGLMYINKIFKKKVMVTSR